VFGLLKMAVIGIVFQIVLCILTATACEIVFLGMHLTKEKIVKTYKEYEK